MARGRLRGEEKSAGGVVEGRFFVGVVLPNQVEVTEGNKKTSVTLSEPRLIHRLGRHLKVNGQTFEPAELRLPDLRLAAQVTDRRVYRLTDTVCAFTAITAFDSVTASSRCQLELEYQGRVMWTQEITLDDFGLHLERFGDLDEGEYRLRLKDSEGKQLAQCRFTVAEYALSTLTAVIRDLDVSKDTARATLEVTRLNLPYTGKLSVGLFCEYCDRVVAESEHDCREGKCELKVSMSGHTGPFSLQLNTPDGDTASVYLQTTRRQYRESICISRLGKAVELSALPQKGAREIRGLYLFSSSTRTAPLVLEENVGETARLKATKKLDALSVLCLDRASGEWRIHEYGALPKGEQVEVEVGQPYSLLLVGALAGNELFEDHCFVFSPVGLQFELEAPAQVEPAQEILLALRANRRSRCLLIVHDTRLERDEPDKELSKRLFDDVRAADASVPRALGAELMEELAEVVPRLSLRAGGGGSTAFYMAAAAPMFALLSPPAPVDYALSIAEEVGSAMQIRHEFPEVVYCELVDVDGETQVAVRLGDQIGKWTVKSYAFADGEWATGGAEVTAEKAAYVEIDAPAVAAEGDITMVKVHCVTPVPATLRLSLPTGVTEHSVAAGEGTMEVAVEETGSIGAQLFNDEYPDVRDEVLKTIEEAGTATVTTSQILSLRPGEVVEGERVVVYPTIGYLLKESVESLLAYPFG